VEERARYELGMVKDGEIFVQVLDGGTKASVTDSTKQ
jgi:cell division protein FtsB